MQDDVRYCTNIKPHFSLVPHHCGRPPSCWRARRRKCSALGRATGDRAAAARDEGAGKGHAGTVGNRDAQVACRERIFGTDRSGRSGYRRATSWSSVADFTRRRSTWVFPGSLLSQFVLGPTMTGARAALRCPCPWFGNRSGAWAFPVRSSGCGRHRTKSRCSCCEPR